MFVQIPRLPGTKSLYALLLGVFENFIFQFYPRPKQLNLNRFWATSSPLRPAFALNQFARDIRDQFDRKIYTESKNMEILLSDVIRLFERT